MTIGRHDLPDAPLEADSRYDQADFSDPFRLGWRYVKRATPDGGVEIDEVPLTLEDLLFPEEEDRAVHHPPHAECCYYL